MTRDEVMQLLVSLIEHIEPDSREDSNDYILGMIIGAPGMDDLRDAVYGLLIRRQMAAL